MLFELLTGHLTGQISDTELMRDEKESLGLFEPLMVSENSKHRSALNDLALELARRSEGFRRSLPPSIATALASLVRSMNCYYSNLIEGHNTHPIDIERALDDDYSTDAEKRNLQLEARAHITVQRWIDENGLEASPTAPQAILEIHKRFCELLPPELLEVEDPATHKMVQVIPGVLRERDVQVGRHVAISPGAVPKFLERMYDVYGQKGRIESILAAACAHHRLLWVHPFIDGNGRVARLMSYAMLREGTGHTGFMVRCPWSCTSGKEVQTSSGYLRSAKAERFGWTRYTQ